MKLLSYHLTFRYRVPNDKFLLRSIRDSIPLHRSNHSFGIPPVYMVTESGKVRPFPNHTLPSQPKYRGTPSKRGWGFVLVPSHFEHEPRRLTNLRIPKGNTLHPPQNHSLRIAYRNQRLKTQHPTPHSAHCQMRLAWLPSPSSVHTRRLYPNTPLTSLTETNRTQMHLGRPLEIRHLPESHPEPDLTPLGIQRFCLPLPAVASH